VERAFGREAGRDVPAPARVAFAPSAAREKAVEKDVQQDVLVIGGLAPRAGDPDSRVMDVVSAALEGTGNRLFTELRDKRSLCYYTGLFYHEFAEGGAYGGYIGTAPSKESEARAALADEMRLVAERGLTDEEIARAKSTLIGNFAIAMQSNEAQMSQIANDWILGRGAGAFERYPDEVRAVTPKAVNAAAGRYMDLDRAAVVVVRPPQP
jgi:zinc protease